jgi:hypothetical protein
VLRQVKNEASLSKTRGLRARIHSREAISATVYDGRYFRSTTNSVREAKRLYSAANRTTSKQDDQQTGRSANRTISVSDPFPLTAMTIGMLGLDQLREPLLAAAFRQIH